VNTLTAKGIDLNSDEVQDSVSDQDTEWQPDSNSDCDGCKL